MYHSSNLLATALCNITFSYLTNGKHNCMTKSHFARSTFLRLNHFTRTWPIFLFLLPVFFVLHGFIPNYEAVSSPDALRLIFLYCMIALVLAGIGWFIYRDLAKAAIFAFLFMAYHFFFGVIQDVLIDRWPNS